MSTQRMFAFAAVALCFGLSAGNQVDAQTYPTQPIKIIVPSAPGGPSDFPARLAAQILPPKLGQPIVVENRGGAGGAIGARAVASAPPDGYTLMIGNTSTLAVIPAVSASAGYDPVKDFTPIAKVTEGFQILVRASVIAVHVDQGAGRLCQGQSGQAQLCPYRRRRAAASGGRAVHAADWRQDDRRLLSQRR